MTLVKQTPLSEGVDPCCHLAHSTLLEVLEKATLIGDLLCEVLLARPFRLLPVARRVSILLGPALF